MALARNLVMVISTTFLLIDDVNLSRLTWAEHQQDFSPISSRPQPAACSPLKPQKSQPDGAGG
jgi:hypothetical protein